MTGVFRAIYRRGHWAHGPALSIGALPNDQETCRVGLRIRRGLKGAVERNRLKRQLRTAVYSSDVPLRRGIDIVIVIHPKQLPAPSADLKKELGNLCRRLGLLS